MIAGVFEPTVKAVMVAPLNMPAMRRRGEVFIACPAKYPERKCPGSSLHWKNSVRSE
jgi:hypothetical protein